MVQRKKREDEQARVRIEPGDRKERKFTWLFIGLILAIAIIGNVFDEDITGKATFYGKGKGIYREVYQPTMVAQDISTMGMVLYENADEVEEFIDEMAGGTVLVEMGQLTKLGKKKFYMTKGPFRFNTANSDEMNDLFLIAGQLAAGGSTFKMNIRGQDYLVMPA